MNGATPVFALTACTVWINVEYPKFRRQVHSAMH